MVFLSIVISSFALVCMSPFVQHSFLWWSTSYVFSPPTSHLMMIHLQQRKFERQSFCSCSHWALSHFGTFTCSVFGVTRCSFAVHVIWFYMYACAQNLQLSTTIHLKGGRGGFIISFFCVLWFSCVLVFVLKIARPPTTWGDNGFSLFLCYHRFTCEAFYFRYWSAPIRAQKQLLCCVTLFLHTLLHTLSVVFTLCTPCWRLRV